MPTVLDELKSAFVVYATKIVAPNDIEKGAYVVNAAQQEVMTKAGVHPVASSLRRTIPIRVVGTSQILNTSYYNAYLNVPNRANEPRMGRDLVNWLRANDELLLGTDGTTVFAHKIMPQDRLPQPAPERVEETVERLFRQISPQQLLERAKRAKSKPPRVPVTVDQFVRDPAVKAFVLRRCGGTCEVPGCGWKGFEKDDGSPFMENHHVKFLSAGGEDTIWNTAGICPNCHRKAHHGKDQADFAKKLLEAIATSTKAFEASV